MSRQEMKRLPLLKRPIFARRIIEIGGGHDPYAGVTHAIDKFPNDNAQRASALFLAKGVLFRAGDLIDIPFGSEPKFDFLYASHVFEHVSDPKRAVDEINRVSVRGFVETPSPLREQMTCPYPYDPKTDFHHLFCWGDGSDTIHVVHKSEKSIGEFCQCQSGQLATRFFEMQRMRGINAEPLLPGVAKTTQLYYLTPLKFSYHDSFESACQAGLCAYKQSILQIKKWCSIPFRYSSQRFLDLHSILKEISVAGK